jgi:hypothetical protein
MKTYLLFFLLLPTLLVSQEPIYSETALIKTIVSYRNKLLLENVNATDSLRVLEQNWMEIDPGNEDFGRIAFNLVAMHNLMLSFEIYAGGGTR